jgi:hypothetical protein
MRLSNPPYICVWIPTPRRMLRFSAVEVEMATLVQTGKALARRPRHKPAAVALPFDAS